MSHSKRSVWIIQQGVWDMPKESMPLAAGYLKAAALADEVIRQEMDVRIFNFGGGDPLTVMAEKIFSEGAPDIMAFSVFGWNYREFGALAETFKQIRPDGWVIFGGTHVANQGARTFRMFPDVDIVANGEGEAIFPPLLRAYLDGRAVADLLDIHGISFRIGDEVHTTPEAARIQDLDGIPSPFLTGAIPLTDRTGEFRYDVALIETNRGCPYKCAFCFWGGAVGQKVRAFSRERLRAELEIFGYHKVHTVVLCDANFGMLQDDLEFVEDVIRTREKFGFPRAVEGSWAKNKSKVFYDIVRLMKQQGMKSSFTLALQTLNDSALAQMHRKNMKLNAWEDLVGWLRAEGLDCYAELIWGAPGETCETFLEGYDKLANYMTRIAVYPLLLLPNTEYTDGRERFGFHTVRGESDDFEYVLANNTMTVEQNLDMKKFILWARSVAEHLVFRHIWAPLRELGGMTQSAVINNMIAWFEASENPAAARLAEVAGHVRSRPSAVPEFLRELYGEPELDELFASWWAENIEPRLPAHSARFISEVFRYDCLSRPIYDAPGQGHMPADSLPAVEVAEEMFYLRDNLRFEYDIPGALRRFHTDGTWHIEERPVTLSVYCKAGFHQYYGNHEQGIYFAGVTEDEIFAPPGEASLAQTRGAE
jgi:radical SAM C-methyltransferase